MRKLMLAVGIIAASLTATGAVAQTATTTAPYPGSPTTTTGGSTSAFLDLGVKPCPSTFDISFTQFNDEVTQSVIDGVVGDDQRPTNGIVTKNVETICSVGANGERLARLRVNGRLYPIKPMGSLHSITVRGTGANGGPRTVTAVFRLGPAGSTTTRSSLARTGDFTLQWAPFGIGLVGIGYLLMVASRRKRSNA